jgi:hypothetical protein
MREKAKLKTILLVWGYDRKGWIAPFEELREEFNFVYLRFISPSNEPRSFTNERKIYWSDYKNAYEVLEDVKPDKVVFMSISTGLDIALNIACKNKNICTFILQHGMFTTYDDYRQREIKYKSLSKTEEETIPVKGFSSLSFFKNGLKIHDYPKLLKIPLYFYLVKKQSVLFASRHVRFLFRKPDYYICYTLKNATIHFEVDSPNKDKVLIIGNPEFDNFVKKWNSIPYIDSNYYLHIDQAFAGNSFGERLVTAEQMVAFILRLNDFCKNKGAILKIKLHPENYASSWLPSNDNIEYIRDTSEIEKLIKNAKGCFGFFSTLLIPAIYYNKVVLFRISNSNFQKHMNNLKLVSVLNFFNFGLSDINFDTIFKQPENLSVFESDYFYILDGRAVERLKNVLAQDF